MYNLRIDDRSKKIEFFCMIIPYNCNNYTIQSRKMLSSPGNLQEDNVVELQQMPCKDHSGGQPEHCRQWGCHPGLFTTSH